MHSSVSIAIGIITLAVSMDVVTMSVAARANGMRTGSLSLPLQGDGLMIQSYRVKWAKLV